VSCRSLPLDDLLEAFSDPGPAPGGGGAAVVAVAVAAALCAMTARLSSRQIGEAPDIVAEALSIRDAMAPLCDADAKTYLRVMAERRRPDDGDSVG
jgi:formiminotetrahydrofolate cyclodeaminase